MAGDLHERDMFSDLGAEHNPLAGNLEQPTYAQRHGKRRMGKPSSSVPHLASLGRGDRSGSLGSTQESFEANELPFNPRL